MIAGLFSVLPLVTEHLPGPLAGLPSSWSEAAAYHALSIESIFGLPFRAFANLVIGFLLFGIALQFGVVRPRWRSSRAGSWAR